jgi:hypothetical protein
VALGSDSPITAAGDLLDEIHYLYTETGLHPNTVYNMVTTGPADIFHLQDGHGRIEKFGVADLIAVRSQPNTPACVLSEITYTDVELVVLAGIVQMASLHLYTRLPHDLRSNLELIEVAGHQRWIRANVRGLFAAAEGVLGHDNLLLSGRKVRYLGAR